MSRKELMLLLLLACINFTHIMDFMIMMPLQEFLVPVFHITPQQFSFLVSAYAFSAFISSLSASLLVDRFDRKRVLLTAYSGFVIGTLGCAFAPTFQLLMVARIVAGFFGGLISAQVLSIVGDTFPYERRGRAMGILMSAFSFAAVAGVPAGLFLASTMSWHIPFLAIGLLGIALIPIAMLLVPSMRSHLVAGDQPTTFEVYKGLFQNRNQQLALLMMLTLVLSHFVAIPFIAPYLEKNVGFTKHQISLMYFIGGIVSLISSPLVGRLSDRIGKHRTLTIFLVLSAVPIYLLTNMPRIPYYYVLIVTGLFFMVAGGRMVPAQALITSVVNPRMRGGFMNINSSIMQLGTALAALLSGSIVTKNAAGELQHYPIVGYIGMSIGVCCLIIAQFVKAGHTANAPVVEPDNAEVALAENTQ